MTAVTRQYNEVGDITAGNVVVRGQLQSSGGTYVAVKTPPFVYVATGLEGAVFSIPFPSARQPGDVAYVAHVQCAGVASMMLVDVPQASYSNAAILVNTSAPLTAGDRLAVIIGDQ